MLYASRLILLGAATQLAIIATSANPQPAATPTSVPALVARAETTTVTTTATISPFAGGIAAGVTGVSGTLPLVCDQGCFSYINPYMNDTLNTSSTTTTSTSTAESCNTVCVQGYRDALAACLNCVIANGDERPYGYIGTTSLTGFSQSALPPAAARSSTFPANDPRPRINNATVANGWLRNVTDFCGGRGVQLTGATTVTAVPTTTGPYIAIWSSGENIVRTQWTGFPSSPAPVITYTQTFTSLRQGAGTSAIQVPGGWSVGAVFAGALAGWAMI